MAQILHIPKIIFGVSRILIFFSYSDTKHSSLFGFNFHFAATASYRLLPEITIVNPCEEELAEKLASCFPEGVIKLEKKNG